MTNLEKFTAAYIEALYFTEEEQQKDGAEIDDLTKCNALNDCRRFFYAYRDQIGENIEQAGHDFWLTRNRHGAGFWDRTEIYGEDNAAELFRACEAMGEVYPEFKSC